LLGNPETLELVGSHGAEVSTAENDEAPQAGHPARSELSPTATTRLAKLRRVLQGITSQYKGVTLEPKPTGIAVHLRNADERDAKAVTSAIEEDPATWAGVHLLRGKKVLELTVVATDKGRALQSLVREHHSTATLFLGDDITDENAFLSLRAPDVGVKVGIGPTAADVRIADPARVSDVLHVLDAARRRARAALRPESHER
jgi:trehalose 6-phosphate synthase/phosphatase